MRGSLGKNSEWAAGTHSVVRSLVAGLRRDGDPGTEDDLQNELRSPKQWSPKHKSTGRLARGNLRVQLLAYPGRGVSGPKEQEPHTLGCRVQDDFAQEPTAHAEARFLWMGVAPVKHKPTIAGGRGRYDFRDPGEGGDRRTEWIGAGEGKAVRTLVRPGLSRRPRRPRPSPASAPRAYFFLNIETFSLQEKVYLAVPEYSSQAAEFRCSVHVKYGSPRAGMRTLHFFTVRHRGCRTSEPSVPPDNRSCVTPGVCASCLKVWR